MPIAWCAELGKWIMVDPLYHAYYRDEEGTVLSPWEIQYDLIHQRPIHVNNDWGSKAHDQGWNRKTLLVFYAKNLCYMGSPVLSTFGSADIEDNSAVWLIPKGFDPIYRELERERFYQMRDEDVVDFIPEVVHHGAGLSAEVSRVRDEYQ